LTTENKKNLIDKKDKDNSNITITRQADLLDISRASIYYEPRKNKDEKYIMDLIDEIYTECPFYGARKIKKALNRIHRIPIGRPRVRRLMNLMGLEAIYPKPKTSIGNKQHKKYPYLLRGLKIKHSNQVWGTDITYIKLEKGWLYLTAIMDWYSRYVLSWQLSDSLESEFCLANLEQALKTAKAKIHNSDQGSQFTSEEYTNKLEEHKIKISMDGRGRFVDNIFTERLWRSVKYEDVYIKSYATSKEVQEGLTKYFQLYNYKRLHQGLNYKTPAEAYFA
jgi:putative transposase